MSSIKHLVCIVGPAATREDGCPIVGQTLCSVPDCAACVLALFKSAHRTRYADLNSTPALLRASFDMIKVLAMLKISATLRTLTLEDGQGGVAVSEGQLLASVASSEQQNCCLGRTKRSCLHQPDALRRSVPLNCLRSRVRKAYIALLKGT